MRVTLKATYNHQMDTVHVWQGLTLVHYSAQPQPLLSQTHTQITPYYSLTSPKHPLNNLATRPLSHRKRLR